jgi:hypothetical protein
MMSGRAFSDPSTMYNVMMGWMQNIDQNLALEYQAYNAWPRNYVSAWSPIIAAGNWKPYTDETSMQKLLRLE